MTALAGVAAEAPLIGWDAAAIVYVVWCGQAIVRLSPTETARDATREDPGRTTADMMLVAAAVASLVGIGVVLVEAGSASGGVRAGLAGVGLASLVCSWFAVHTVFTLHYARLFYSGGRGGGVNFHQDLPPRYTDFAYLAFTIGMTFQVSDTEINDPRIRATILRHGLISYLFGAGIVAAAINLVVSLGTKNGGG